MFDFGLILLDFCAERTPELGLPQVSLRAPEVHCYFESPVGEKSFRILSKYNPRIIAAPYQGALNV